MCLGFCSDSFFLNNPGRKILALRLGLMKQCALFSDGRFVFESDGGEITAHDYCVPFVNGDIIGAFIDCPRGFVCFYRNQRCLGAIKMILKRGYRFVTGLSRQHESFSIISPEMPRLVTLNDMFEFDLQTLQWKEIPQRGNIPVPRQTPTLIKFKNNCLVSFGGKIGEHVHLSELHFFNLELLEWKNIGDVCLAYPHLRQGKFFFCFQDVSHFFVILEHSNGEFATKALDIFRIAMFQKPFFDCELLGTIEFNCDAFDDCIFFADCRRNLHVFSKGRFYSMRPAVDAPLVALTSSVVCDPVECSICNFINLKPSNFSICVSCKAWRCESCTCWNASSEKMCLVCDCKVLDLQIQPNAPVTHAEANALIALRNFRKGWKFNDYFELCKKKDPQAEWISFFQSSNDSHSIVEFIGGDRNWKTIRSVEVCVFNRFRFIARSFPVLPAQLSTS